MKDITRRRPDSLASRGYVIPGKSWDEIARFYRDTADFAPMLPLVEALATSPAARELWAYTSMHTLCISDSADHRSRDSTLHISYNPTQHTFEFCHNSFSRHDDRMTCSEPEALKTLRNFVKYKFAVLLDGP